MRILLSPDLLKTLRKIKAKDQILASKIERKLFLFVQNPGHPSLRTHKLTGEFENRWSISINRNIRMVYIIQAEDKEEFAYFIAIGTHEQVYRK